MFVYTVDNLRYIFGAVSSKLLLFFKITFSLVTFFWAGDNGTIKIYCMFTMRHRERNRVYDPALTFVITLGEFISF